MIAQVILDVDIRDMERYQAFMKLVKPAVEAAGERYLAPGGVNVTYAGYWQPRRIVLMESPSVAAWEAFYTGSVYQGMKSIRDGCSTARLVSVKRGESSFKTWTLARYMTHPQIHPLIAIFQQRAEMLDMQGSLATTDDAIGMLAAWIEAAQAKITDDDLVILGEIGGTLYRDGLQRKRARS